MPEYVVYRHGGAPSVEGETLADRDKRPVARLFANDPDEACRQAAQQVALAPGQWLSADLADEVDAKLNEVGLPQEALDELENP